MKKLLVFIATVGMLACVSANADPSSSGNLSWDDWYEQDGYIHIVEPKYNGTMINNIMATLERFCYELDLEFVSVEHTLYMGGSNTSAYSYGYNYGAWEQHSCSYASWTWDDCSHYPSRIIATACASGPFIDEFHDFDDNLVPPCWTQLIQLGGPGIYDGMLRGNVTDGRVRFSRQGYMPEEASGIKLEYDGNIAYTYWGMTHSAGVVLSNGDAYHAGTVKAQYNYGTGIMVSVTGAGERLYFENHPEEYGDYHNTVTIRDEQIDYTATRHSDGYVLCDLSLPAPGLQVSDISEIYFWVHTTTNSNAWSDNVRITLLGPDTGSISGLVTCETVGIHGVPVDLYDDEGNILLSSTTDESGWYQFPGQDFGTYFVSISTPLGYFTDEETKKIELASVEQEVNFELTQLSITPQQRSRGYWAHQLYKALEGKPQDYTIEDFSHFGGLIDQHFYSNLINPVEFYWVAQPAVQQDSLDVMRELLYMGDRGENYPFPKRIARAQLLALMLNIVSGRLHQMQELSVDDRTASQTLTYCDWLINDELEPPYDTITGYSRDLTEWYSYVVAEYILHMANVGLEIPAGLVPVSTANIAYHVGSGGLPSEFELRQNYPNPFNPVTEICFALPQSCNVKLEIFNIIGQKVTTLVDGAMPAGHHTAQWDGGTSAASGFYMYRLTAGDFVETKKMILIK